MPATKIGEKTLWNRSDWLSVLDLTAAISLTLLGVARQNIYLLAISVVAWITWVMLARREANSSIPPAMLGNRRFITASLAASIRMLVAVAALIALPLFFEDVQGLTPSAVGSVMVIYSIFLFLGSWPGGRWSDRVGAVVPGTVGYLAMIAGILLLLPMGLKLVLGLVALALAIRGLGAGLSQAPYTKAATGAVPAHQTQAAAGMYGTIRYSGLALGTALVGIFLQTRLSYHDAPGGGASALAAYQELWLLLAAILVAGLGMTLLMGRSRPVSAPAVVGN
jgi:predicted MFS family arabinose efflux permease